MAELDEIVAEADGMMVARGDLGVEMPLQEVPTVQKKIIRTTVINGKPVMTATQMLDSMQRNPTPTRAEVSDVANAIFDGTSAVMLSSETAAGAYPVEAVRTMATLALEAEASLDEYGHLQQIRPEATNVVTDAVSQAAITMATHLRAAAIVALTESGFTARAISKYGRAARSSASRAGSGSRAARDELGRDGVRFDGETRRRRAGRLRDRARAAAGHRRAGRRRGRHVGRRQRDRQREPDRGPSPVDARAGLAGLPKGSIGTRTR